MDTNEELKSQLFDASEITHIKNAKGFIEEIIPYWVKSNSYVVVAGGCFASRLQSEVVKDIDIFVLGNSSPVEEQRMHETIKNKMRLSFPVIADKTADYMRNNKAVSEVWTDTKSRIQFIFTHHATREDLIKDFDYVHCMTSYQNHILYVSRQIYDAIIEKRLIVNNDKNIQEWRKNKFLNRGYKEAGPKELTLGDILTGALKKVA